jgi:hypothetical protein
LAQRTFHKRGRLITSGKRDADHAATGPNALAFSRRKRAAYESVKIATISRAQRSDCNALLDGNLGIWRSSGKS